MAPGDPLATVRRRLAVQGLLGEGFPSPAAAVAGLGAVQAQEYAEAKWSLGQRVRGVTDADVEEACNRGDILRTHVLRPTWHFVTPADIRWLLRLTAPRVQAANRYWYAQLGLDDRLLSASRGVLARALEGDGPRTRTELARALAAAGIEAAGPRLGYLCMYAELTELICSGPRRGRQQTYALLDERAPPGPLDDLPPGEARAELVRRYFTGHGPATIADLANWSSLTVADVKAGLERVGDELKREDDERGRTWYSALVDPGQPAPVAPAQPAPVDAGAAGREPTGAFLVPMYDETVMYRDVRVVLAAEPVRAGLLQRAVVIDGRTVGSWRRTLTARAVTVEATLFAPIGPEEGAALHDVVGRFGRFLGLPAELRAEVASA